jgi:hypothetical protein
MEEQYGQSPSKEASKQQSGPKQAKRKLPDDAVDPGKHGPGRLAQAAESGVPAIPNTEGWTCRFKS